MTTSKKVFELDFVGDAYHHTLGEDNLGTFSLTAHLKEAVDPVRLNEAYRSLLNDLPYLNGKVDENGKYVLLNLSEYQSDLFKVSHEQTTITIETSHTIMDGRGLSRVTTELLNKYYSVESTLMPSDNKKRLYDEQVEDAFTRFAGQEQTEKKQPLAKKKAYKHAHQKDLPVKMLSKTFDVTKLKEEARQEQTTISEYLLAKIFLAIAKERDEAGSKKPIVADVPVDYRKYFPTESIRNFIGFTKIVMPEVKTIGEMAPSISKQFATLTKESIGNKIKEAQMGKENLNKMPPKLKKMLLKVVSNNENKKATFVFSNLGQIHLPAEVQNKVAHLEFVINPTPGIPYTFSCVSVGNALTLTATIEKEGTIFENIT